MRSNNKVLGLMLLHPCGIVHRPFVDGIWPLRLVKRKLSINSCAVAPHISCTSLCHGAANKFQDLFKAWENSYRNTAKVLETVNGCDAVSHTDVLQKCVLYGLKDSEKDMSP
jgi:hypothetical protein